MSALLSGYEYDIFISYRHNDNLDGWVTDFVENLEKELRGTLKDSLTIYFDRNPHDGLLETHHVDKSLEGKLKCLIFIPIVSQTYCDTKSFAWQHEFVAFNKFVKEDQYGREIKLTNGNVASRILPIKIHNLDLEDKALLENEIEGTLRPIEFIFKSAGVNRPLHSKEDHPQDNLNKTFYRDQINKVANVVKDIVRSLKDPTVHPTTTVDNHSTIVSKRKGVVIGLVAISVLIVILISIWPHKKVELSIAVLPFKNLSEDKNQEYFADGLTDDITDRLAKIKKLRVISRTSVDRYKGNPPSIPQIGKELNVSYILEGSVRRQGNQLKVVVQLIEARTDDHLWSETIEGDASDIFKIQAVIATRIARYLDISLTVNEQGELNDIPTQSIQAYDLYLQGTAIDNARAVVNDRKILNFRKATKLDPEFAEAYDQMASCFRMKAQAYGEDPFWYDSALIYSAKAIKLKPSHADGYKTMGQIYAAQGKWEIAKPYLLKSNNLQPGSGTETLSLYMRTEKHQLDSAIYYITSGTKYHPTSQWPFIRLAETLIDLGLYDSAMRSYDKAFSLSTDPIGIKSKKGGLLIIMKQYDQAIEYLNKNIIAVDTTEQYLSISKKQIAIAYLFKEDWTKASSYLQKNGFADDELMALAWIKTAEPGKAQKIIKNKKAEFTKSNDQPGLARVAILENDLSTAAKILSAAYSNYATTPYNIDRNPFYKELNNTKEYIDLMSKIDDERKAALASIKAMNLSEN